MNGMSRLDERAWKFFHETAGYIVGERAIGAATLARAEAALRSRLNAGTARIRWEWDSDSDLSWMSEADRKRDHECLACIVETRCEACGAWQVAASLYGIVDADREYRRVVEAELACEVM